jgi:hypothetical protein
MAARALERLGISQEQVRQQAGQITAPGTSSRPAAPLAEQENCARPCVTAPSAVSPAPGWTSTRSGTPAGGRVLTGQSVHSLAD